MHTTKFEDTLANPCWKTQTALIVHCPFNAILNKTFFFHFEMKYVPENKIQALLHFNFDSGECL